MGVYSNPQKDAEEGKIIPPSNQVPDEDADDPFDPRNYGGRYLPPPPTEQTLEELGDNPNIIKWNR